ncbi:MAG: amidohydrolase family protein [Armatimonadetes bacterium]|nr:amidohydrolase family protein [Armatimonadota bacterium]
MPTDLAQFIATSPLADTHEHQNSEAAWQASPPDVLCDVFDHYSDSDLVSAGAPQSATAALFDASRDVADRFRAIEPWWQHIQHTGYGEAVRIAARLFYDLEELTPSGLAAANNRAATYRQPGQRDRIFREIARLDHVQIDHFSSFCQPDPVDPSFYRYDISWAGFSGGGFGIGSLAAATDTEITGPESLRAALGELVVRNAPHAVAAKSQHAYERTLAWQERDDAEVAPLIAAKLHGTPLSREQLNALGDWCLAVGAEACGAVGLPVKIHTGHWAGNGGMKTEYVRPGLLSPLLARYPGTRFVLMHAGWPYSEELIALAKHFANVVGDCCWAWSMAPLSVRDFIRHWLHAAPLNKLLTFGGDTGWPISSAAYAHQARAWLTRALQAEVDEGLMSEAQAISAAGRLMVANACEVFGL